MACIGIDASRALSAAPTGTEGYSYHLIHALLPHLIPQHTVRLYFRRPPEPEDFPEAEVCVIPFPRLWTHARLSWEMMRRPPDLLFVPAHVLPPIRPARTLVTIHDLGYRYYPDAHPWQQRLYLDASTRWNARIATHVLADSNATCDALIREYAIPAAKITVAYPGYDQALSPVRDPVRLAEVRARYGIPGAYILYLGRIQPRKNLTRLIEAFASVYTHHPELTLVLAGPIGWLAEPIQACARALNLESNVHSPGYIAAEDKAALISGARIFAYPSLYEGFGFPVLEAQACHTPLLASHNASLPEVVGEGGLIVDPLDTTAIAAGLLRLLEDDALRRALIAQGIANVQRFSWATTARIVAMQIEALLYAA